MSVVVVKRRKDGGFDFAADSIVARGWTTEKKGQAKMFRAGNVLVGSVGAFEETSLLQNYASSHTVLSPTEKDVLDWLVEFSDWKNKRTGSATIENNYLVGIGKAVFLIEGWLVQEVQDFHAIGAGRDFALAALYLGHGVRKAAVVACELSAFCTEPINIDRI